MQIFAIALIFLLVTIKTPFIWFLYVLFLPGFSILSLTDVKTKDKILFALPFSLLFVHWPYFLLTRLGIGIPSIYFTVMPLIYMTIYIIKRKSDIHPIKNINFKFDGRIKKDTFYTLILSSVLLFAFYYSFEAFASPETYPPFQKGMNAGVPRTLGAKYVAETQMVKDNIIAGIGEIGWSDKWFSGMHTLTSYSPLSYIILAVDSLNYEVWRMHNLHVYLFSYLFAIYLYYLLRYMNINRYTSLTISIISAILPPFIQVNNVFKTSVDLAFLPLVLYSLLLILNNPNKINTALFSVTLSMWVMNYYLTTFMLIYQFALFTLYYIYKSDKKIATLSSVTKASFVAFLIGGIWELPFLHGIFTKTFSMMRYIEGGWFSPMKSVGEIIGYMAGTVNPNDIQFDLHAFTTFSPQFFYIGLISAIIILILSVKDKTKMYLITVLPIMHLAYIFIQLTPLRDILPFYYSVYGQIYLFFPMILFFAISYGLLIQYISEHMSLKYTLTVTSVLLIIIFIPVFQYSHNMGSFLSEGSVVNGKNLEWLYRPMEQIGKGGSFALFGLYGPGYIPGITQYADIQAFSGYGIESHMTLQAYEKRIVPLQEASMDNLLTDNPRYAYNIFKQSNVRSLVFQRCSYTNTGQMVLDPNSIGGKAYETLSKESRFIIITNESCIALMTTTGAQKAEKIFLTEVLVDNPTQDDSKNAPRGASHKDLEKYLSNREKAINSLLTVPAGEHLHFTAKEFAYPKNRYANIIINRTTTEEEISPYIKNNSTVIYFKDDIKIDNPNFHSYKEYPKNETELNEILGETRYIDTPVQFKQDKTNYEFNENGFILLKETYFRKWHSNAEIKEDYLGFILVDSKGNTKLWFGPTYIDYAGGFLTIIGIIIIITMIIIANKRESITKYTDDQNEKKEKQKNLHRNPKNRRRKRHH